MWAAVGELASYVVGHHQWGGNWNDLISIISSMVGKVG